ncbi:hypothetical protein OROHE_015495 [Orobanche hederae]
MSWESQLDLCLIKSVMAAIPIHVMQAGWLPESVCNKLDKLNRQFLWSADTSQCNLHLINWKTKKNGGLGFRDTRTNNEALLSKVVWKILRKEKSVWVDPVTSKYLKGSSILNNLPKATDSMFWKGVTRSAILLQPYFHWRLGDGRTIRFWSDIWFNGTAVSNRVRNIDNRDRDVRIFPVQLQDELEAAKILRLCDDDMVFWSETSSGVQICQSALQALKSRFEGEADDQRVWTWIWRTPINNMSLIRARLMGHDN